MAKLTQYYGTGRRKTSVARVYLRPGHGRITVQVVRWYISNGKAQLCWQPLS